MTHIDIYAICETSSTTDEPRTTAGVMPTSFMKRWRARFPLVRPAGAPRPRSPGGQPFAQCCEELAIIVERRISDDQVSLN